MPIHDWTKMFDGDFHDFHQSWIIELRNALNRGLLPDGFMAMSDQVTGGPIPDVVALRRDSGGLAVKAAPPTAKMVAKFERDTYADRADRIDRLLTVRETMSPEHDAVGWVEVREADEAHRTHGGPRVLRTLRPTLRCHCFPDRQ